MIFITQDILYDDLNCYEHLELYASLKGISKVVKNAKVIKSY